MFIPYGHQSIDDDDIAAVTSVLKSDWLTQGPAVRAFEDALCEITDAQFAIAFANGTATLHAACSAAGIGPGDLLITSPLSFAASANCARYVGATVGFVDIDPATLNLDASKIPSDTTALVPVHYAGLPVDLISLGSRPRVIIEDAAHAIGARTPQGPVGNCAQSEMTSFSFHPVKTITTGEGGAVTTNSEELAEKLRRFRSHGIVKHPDQGGWYYNISEVGYNYRLSDIHAALGTSQLRKLHRFIARRNEIAERYRDALSDSPVLLPPSAPEGFRHAYHLFVARVPNRRAVYEALHRADIGVQVHYVPIYRHSAYADSGFDPGEFPNTEDAYEHILSLPIFPDLTDEQQDRVIEELLKAVA